ncbi:MAG: hypothetical protein ABIE22_03495 [archaeon]
MDSRKRVFLTVVGLTVLVLAFYFVAMNITKYTGYVAITEKEDYDSFAQCLTDQGVIMYGSELCGHCKNQKETFGESFKYVTYVECTEQPEACAGLRGVPAWDINGEIIYGEQSLEKLAELAGCDL